MSLLKSKIRKIKKITAEINEEDIIDLNESEGIEIAEERKKMGKKLRKHRNSVRKHWMSMSAGICLTLIGVLMLAYVHVGTNYIKIKEEERSDIAGTVFEEYAEGMLKYSSDGISYLDKDHAVKWSSTFSMQSPMVDICEKTLVAADQKGTQIYVFNENGQLGQFKTSLPIEKVRVAKQGVVAAVLGDGDVTWINLYDSAGNEIVRNKSSVEESGYPLDMDISPDGMKMVVSYLKVRGDGIATDVCYYNFDSVGQAEVNNLVSAETYRDTVIPETIFLNDTRSLVLRNDGFSIYSGKQIPELKTKVDFEEEILSAFYNEDILGFAFKSDKPDSKYKIQLYNINGKQRAKLYTDVSYKEIKIREGNVILFNEKTFEICSTGGKKKFVGDFEKPIQNIISIKGFRKYQVFTKDQQYVIRLG